jgi:hypothetical protein
MTGIGFLGAGVIMQEGLSVRGLTTAASIWITAAIGILAGIGFYFPMALSVVLVLGVLSTFRWIEARMPTQAYYHFEVRFSGNGDINEGQIRELVERHAFSIANFSYRLDAEGRVRRYSMTSRRPIGPPPDDFAAMLESAEYQEFNRPNRRLSVATSGIKREQGSICADRKRHSSGQSGRARPSSDLIFASHDPRNDVSSRTRRPIRRAALPLPCRTSQISGDRRPSRLIASIFEAKP